MCLRNNFLLCFRMFRILTTFSTLSCIIIHQIYSLAGDWSKLVMRLNTGEYPNDIYSPTLKRFRVFRKNIGNYKHNNFYLARNYAWKVFLGHYLLIRKGKDWKSVWIGKVRFQFPQGICLLAVFPCLLFMSIRNSWLNNTDSSLFMRQTPVKAANQVSKGLVTDNKGCHKNIWHIKT